MEANYKKISGTFTSKVYTPNNAFTRDDINWSFVNQAPQMNKIRVKIYTRQQATTTIWNF